MILWVSTNRGIIMRILIISSSGEGGGKHRVRFGATLRTLETSTKQMKENAKLTGHKLYTRREVPDILIDATYNTIKDARVSAETLKFGVITAQKLAWLAMQKRHG